MAALLLATTFLPAQEPTETPPEAPGCLVTLYTVRERNGVVNGTWITSVWKKQREDRHVFSIRSGDSKGRLRALKDCNDWLEGLKKEREKEAKK